MAVIFAITERGEYSTSLWAAGEEVRSLFQLNEGELKRLRASLSYERDKVDEVLTHLKDAEKSLQKLRKTLQKEDNL